MCNLAARESREASLLPHSTLQRAVARAPHIRQVFEGEEMIHRFDRGSRAAAGAAGLCALLAQPTTFAQETAASDESSGGLQEVVVSAQFREEKLQDTPIAITAVTEEMMRARGQDSIFDVTQQAPNVQIKKNAGVFGASTSAFIRGIGQGDFNFALEPGVGMYIDDVYFPTMTGSAFEIVDLERVEVLRGPQGTLQGRNAIGGSVRLITRKPTGDGSNYVEVTTGRYDRLGLRAAGETAFGDKLFLRVTGASNTQDGYVERRDFACDQPAVAASLGITSSGTGKAGCKLGTLGGQSYTAGRANLRWLPTDALEVNLIGDLTNDRSEATALVMLDSKNVPAMGPQWGPWFNVQPGEFYSYETFTSLPSGPGPGFIRTPYTTPAINHFEGWGGALVIDYELNETMSLKSITSRRSISNDFATANDGSPLDGETGFNELSGHSFQEEIRLNGTAGPVDYTVGLFYFEQKNRNRNRIDIGYIAGQGAFDFISDELAESKSQAAFVHGVWHATDRLTVTAGLRYSDENKEQLLARLNSGDGGLSASVVFPDLIPLGGYAPSVEFADERFDYRVSIDYRWSDTFMTYLTNSTGFKNGGVSPRFFFVSHILPFGVEELNAYELGFKSDLRDLRMRVNGAIFLNKYTDQQIGAPGSICPGLSPPAPCLATVNGQDSEYRGAELEVTVQPWDAATIDFSASWIDAKYTKVDPLVLANPNFIRDPDAPPGIPQYKLSLGVMHSFEFGSAGTLTPRVDYNYEAERTPAVSNSKTTPAFGVVNARATWESADSKWETALGVTNITNKYYYYNIFDLATFGGWTTGQPAPPREWSLTLRRSF
jgi:iron complex outermembrane recepter protein